MFLYCTDVNHGRWHFKMLLIFHSWTKFLSESRVCKDLTLNTREKAYCRLPKRVTLNPTSSFFFFWYWYFKIYFKVIAYHFGKICWTIKPSEYIAFDFGSLCLAEFQILKILRFESMGFNTIWKFLYGFWRTTLFIFSENFWLSLKNRHYPYNKPWSLNIWIMCPTVLFL